MLLQSYACAGLPAHNCCCHPLLVLACWHSCYCHWLIVQFLPFIRIILMPANAGIASHMHSLSVVINPASLGIWLCCCCHWWLIVFKETIFILSKVASVIIITDWPQLWPEYRGLQAMCCCSQACIAVLALAAWCIGFHCWSVIVSSATAWCCCHLGCCQCHHGCHLSHHRLIVAL